MRLATYTSAGVQHYGLVTDGGMIALDGRYPDWPSLRAVIAAEGLARLADQVVEVTHPTGSFTWDIPVPDPEKIICVGVNYPDRNAEYKDGQDAPLNPSLFVRFARSFTGHDQPLIRPPETAQLDYEGEVALIIGRAGRRIAERDALDHVAALTLCNEGTLRDWVRHGKFNVTQGKNWDRSGAMGPWIVPFTDEGQLADIRLTTTVNGAIRQDDRTSRMIFSFRQIIAYVSTFITLVPGDVLVCGTPTGAGARLDPPVWLAPGDVVSVTAEGIGTLTNGVADEA
jgi:2-keto-4-pentenoate hydratase/2-oxohepta-3-ene-1,7-dioic acid hydratase in catechol pathway